MQPQAPNRAIVEMIRQVLGDDSLRGEALLAAIAGLSARGLDDPFRACLRQLGGVDRPEAEARDALGAIESHRAGLCERLQRDPGAGVAAADFLIETESAGPDPLPRAWGRGRSWASPGPDEMSLDDRLALEIVRSERSGRPLSLVVLAPDRPVGAGADLAAAGAALRDAAREVDHAARILPEGFVVILPCTDSAQASGAAGRLRAVLEAVMGEAWSAGVSSRLEIRADAAELARGAGEALVAARRRGGAVVEVHRGERRSHPRRAAAESLRARLSADGRETDAVVEDLSIGGARLKTRERLAPGTRVLLSLSGLTARPRHLAVASRVLRAHPAPGASRAALWMAGVAFTPGPDVRRAVAGILADLPRAPGGAEPDR